MGLAARIKGEIFFKKEEDALEEIFFWERKEKGELFWMEGGTGRRIGGLGEILRIFEEKAQRSRKGASATEFVQEIA